MARLTILSLSILWVVTTAAQDVRLIYNNTPYTGTVLDNGIVDFEGANAMLIPNEKLVKIKNELEFLRIQAHEDSIQKAELRKIITAYENYEKGADTLIKNQRAIMATADSLYTGYKDLYHDLKKLYRLRTFSLIPGIGLAHIDSASPRANLIFSAGFEYNNINLNAMIGKGFQGATVGYRFGF